MPINQHNDAEIALERAREARDYIVENYDNLWSDKVHRFKSQWTDLLLYGSRVFTKTQQLSKQFKNQSWFAQYAAARKNDELLKFMHHARNVDEHFGLALTYELEEEPGEIEAVAGKPFGLQLHVDEKGRIFGEPKTPWTKVKNNGSKKYVLVEITDRAVPYSPPAWHLGQPVKADDLGNIAKLYVDYLERMMSDFRAQELKTDL